MRRTSLGRRFAFVALFAMAAFVALFAMAARARADVADVADNGFTIRSSALVSASPEKAYAALVDVGRWWDPEHTFSHDARNLSIEAKPQGCFCETLPSRGGVRHLTVIYAAPGELLRLEGGLGPLQTMGVAGVLTWKLQPAEKGTTVEMSYVVGGYNPAGFKNLAPVVDSVLRSQLERFARYVNTGKP